MKRILFSTFFLLTVCYHGSSQTTWGNNSTRTETRNDANTWGNGVMSGFYETSNPVNFPSSAAAWWHLLDIRLSATGGNFAMQFAGKYDDQKLYFRKTYTGNAATSPAPWNRVLVNVDDVVEGPAGIVMSKYSTGGAWIDLPTAGPTGFGTTLSNGAKNPWIGYAAGTNQWFPNASAGDVCYRNIGGKILLGNSESVGAVMAVTGNKIGIGTINPTEVLSVVGNISSVGNLSVNGNITSKKVKVTSLGWADYVFEPAYKLPSLKQIEAHIAKYKHLPDVPSAKQVEEDGLDLGSSQATLLRKIEELTLYVIEQNKRLDKQQKQIEGLKKKVK